MPRAPVFGRTSRQPLAFTSFDIADEPSQRVLSRPAARPLGGLARGIVRPGARPVSPFGDGGGSFTDGPRRAIFGRDFKSGVGGGLPDIRVPRRARDPGGPNALPEFDPDDPLSGFPNLQIPIQNLIAEGGRQGVFTPDYLINLLRRRALGNADAQRARTRTLAGLSGLDPIQYRGALLDADIAANSEQVRALNEAELQGGLGYRDVILDLLRRERGFGEAAEQANIGRRFQEEQSGGFGGFLGSLLGLGGGAFLGEAGGSLGRRV